MYIAEIVIFGYTKEHCTDCLMNDGYKCKLYGFLERTLDNRLVRHAECLRQEISSLEKDKDRILVLDNYQGLMKRNDIRNNILSEIACLNQMIIDLPKESIIDRNSLEARLKEVEKELEEFGSGENNV